MRASGATDSVTIVGYWKASRGGSARVAHGGTCQPISQVAAVLGFFGGNFALFSLWLPE
jgi:hypothetical protein